MEKLTEFYAIVEEGIRLGGVDPALCRTENEEGQWNLKRGELEIWVDVLPIEDLGQAYFQVMTPISEVPDHRREEFYKELLEINYQLVEANFVTFNDGAYIKIMREMERISPTDVLISLNRLAHYGNIFIEEIRTKYQTEQVKHKD